jgi:hypothetical protein
MTQYLPQGNTRMTKAVHFSITPLAGAPIRIVQAINRLTTMQARLVDQHRFGIYDHDLVFSESPDEALRLSQDADIIHLHNYLDLDSSQFTPINFRVLHNSGKRVIRHFHSSADWIAEQMGISEERLLHCNLPSLVIPQYPERFFPKSRIIPYVIPHADPQYLPLTADEKPIYDLFFSPTKSVGAFERRWDTKAAPETSAIIRGVAEQTGCSFNILTGRPLSEVLAVKRLSRIVIDDLATGSYHLTGLEGLSQGKPVLSFLDERSLRLLRYVSGSDHCPFINVRLEDVEEVLLWLLAHPEECDVIGRDGREWMLTYWNEKKMIKNFVQAYGQLLQTPSLVCRQEDLFRNDGSNDYLYRILPDLIFNARSKRWVA